MPMSSTSSTLGTSIETGEIADGAVTTAKIADNAVNGAKLGIGTTNGDTILFDGTDWARLAIGSNAQVLRSNGTTAAWASLSVATAWERLTVDSLGADAATLASSTFTARKNLMVLVYTPGSSVSAALAMRCNADAGANYSVRKDDDGVTAASTSQTEAPVSQASGAADVRGHFAGLCTNNVSTQRKYISFQSGTASSNAATAPSTSNGSMIWHNTANQITSFTVVSGSGNLRSGTEIHVYGCD